MWYCFSEWPKNGTVKKITTGNNVFIVSVIVYSHAAVFISNVQFVRLAVERPTQAGDATDQWRDRWNAATVCPTQWRLPALAGWLSWIVDVDRPSVESAPQKRNRLDSTPGCLGATCEAWWTWRSHAAGTSVCSWQCLTSLLLQDVTITLDNNWDNKRVVLD